MKLLHRHVLSAAGLQAQALGKLPAVGAVQVTPPQAVDLAARVVTETASPSYWNRYLAWETKLNTPTVMPWEKMESGVGA